MKFQRFQILNSDGKVIPYSVLDIEGISSNTNTNTGKRTGEGIGDGTQAVKTPIYKQTWFWAVVVVIVLVVIFRKKLFKK